MDGSPGGPARRSSRGTAQAPLMAPAERAGVWCLTGPCCQAGENPHSGRPIKAAIIVPEVVGKHSGAAAGPAGRRRSGLHRPRVAASCDASARIRKQGAPSARPFPTPIGWPTQQARKRGLVRQDGRSGLCRRRGMLAQHESGAHGGTRLVALHPLPQDLVEQVGWRVVSRRPVEAPVLLAPPGGRVGRLQVRPLRELDLASAEAAPLQGAGRRGGPGSASAARAFLDRYSAEAARIDGKVRANARWYERLLSNYLAFTWPVYGARRAPWRHTRAFHWS